MNPYEVLGIEEDADQETIKHAYRTLSKTLHPDMNNGDDKGFAKLNLAYRILSDPQKKRLYDEYGAVMDESIDHIENLVKERVMSIADKWIDGMINGSRANLNVFIAREVCSVMNQIDGANKGIKKGMKKLDGLKEKITCSSGENLFHRMIERRIAANEQAIQQNVKKKIILQRIEESLNNYEQAIEDPVDTSFEGLLFGGIDMSAFIFRP